MNSINPQEPATDESSILWAHDPREACRRWLKSHEHQAYAPHSIEQYAAMTGHAAQWLDQAFGRNLLQANAQDLQALLAALRGRAGKPASVATRKRYVAVLRVVMAHLHQLGLREDNPSTQLQYLQALATQPRQAPRFLDETQALRYVDWVLAQPHQSWGELRDAALRLVYLACGITVNESRLLLLGDLLLDERPEPLLRIRAVSPVLARSIPLPEWCLPVMQQWHGMLASQMPSRSLVFPAARPQLAADAKPSHHQTAALSTSEIYDTVRPAMLAAGFEDEQLGPQTLRNTYAVRQLCAGMDSETLRQRMGLHTTWSIDTLRREWQARNPTTPP